MQCCVNGIFSMLSSLFPLPTVHVCMLSQIYIYIYIYTYIYIYALMHSIKTTCFADIWRRSCACQDHQWVRRRSYWYVWGSHTSHSPVPTMEPPLPPTHGLAQDRATASLKVWYSHQREEGFWEQETQILTPAMLVMEEQQELPLPTSFSLVMQVL